jgi:hypothetical protein
MLQPKKGICLDCGYRTFLIAKRCKPCYWRYRARLKNQNKPSLFAMFERIWATREHKSFLSGKPLHEFSVSFFAHIVSKKKRPDLAYREDNIALLTLEEHHLYDHGTIEKREAYAQKNRVSWDTLFNLRDKLLSEPT